MKFARFVFIGAGVWGVVVLTPLIFLVDISGRYYLATNFLSAVLLRFHGRGAGVATRLPRHRVGSDPVPAPHDPRHRREGGFIIPASVLYAHGRITARDASAAMPDAILGAVFVLAFLKSGSARPGTSSRPW